MFDWLYSWEGLFILFYVLEKFVKVSPAKWDDILIDGLMAMANELREKEK